MKPGIYIAGTGNLATALGKELKAAATQDYRFAGWLSRHPEHTALNPVLDYDSIQIQTGDVVFLCVQDKHIFDLAPSFSVRGAYVIHCSGALPLQQNGVKCDAVFWPMQTFRAEFAASWAGVPVLMQTESPVLSQLLFDIGVKIGAEVMVCSEEQRLKMHLSAVLANNFVNALIRAAELTAESAGFAANKIHPILQQTITNAIGKGAINAQTGPALRGDKETMNKHLQLLEKEPELLKLYKDISAYISILFK